MSTPHLTLGWLEDIDKILREEAMKGIFSASYLCKKLYDIGFEKFTYFELSTDVLCNSEVYVLQNVGKDVSVPASEQTILPATAVNRFTPTSALQPYLWSCAKDQQCSELRSFQSAIGSDGIPTISVPIHAGYDLVGKFCVSWRGSPRELTSDDWSSFVIMSRLCGRYLRLARDMQLKVALKDISAISFNSEEDGYVGAHSRFLAIIERFCPSFLSSVFEYNWADGFVTKICESAAITTTYFPEKYARGDNLTGFAFNISKPFLVTRVDRLARESVPRLNEDSLNRHALVIPTDLSVLYAQFESGHRDFVVRLLSKSGSLTPYFSNTDLEFVAQLCRRFGFHSNEFANQKNLSIIRHLFYYAISDFSKYNSVLEQFHESYRRVFTNKLSLLARHTAGRDGELQDANIEFACFGCNQKIVLGDMDIERFDRFVKRAKNEKILFVPSESLNTELGAEVTLNHLGNLAVIIPLADADINGIIFTQVHSNLTQKDLLSFIKPKTRETLSIISAVIASAISASSSHITTQNAKRLIGHIGHEIETPISNLSDTALASLKNINRSLVKVTEITPEIIDGIKGHITDSISDIQEISSGISLLMDVATDMATETENRLEYTFKPFNLSDAITSAADRVSKEVERYHSIGTRVNFIFNERSKIVNRFVGDRFLVDKILINMFRNAIKYSYSGGGGKPIEIKVNVITQQNLIDIEIINWGVPIDIDEFERIFEPFYRGSVKDPIRARRGMGLGLYIARRFSRVHSGTVRCKSSEPTFDDPKRRELEGYLNKFVIRLSATLPITTSEARLG